MLPALVTPSIAQPIEGVAPISKPLPGLQSPQNPRISPVLPHVDLYVSCRTKASAGRSGGSQHQLKRWRVLHLVRGGI